MEETTKITALADLHMPVCPVPSDEDLRHHLAFCGGSVTLPLSGETVPVETAIAALRKPPADVIRHWLDNELADFAMVIRHCSTVYSEVTGGRISKPTTLPEEVLAVANDLETERTERAVAEAVEEAKEDHERTKKLLADCRSELETVRGDAQRERDGREKAEAETTAALAWFKDSEALLKDTEARLTALATPAPTATPETIIGTIRWVLADAHYKAPEQIAGCWRETWAPMLRRAVDAMPVGLPAIPAAPAPDAVREAAEIEAMAAAEHERWAGWYRHQRDNSTPERVARWDRLADTPYADLDEELKEKDRSEVRKLLAARDGGGE